MSAAAITLTGADERTDLRSLVTLAERPGVEIGLLLSLSNSGNRYPGQQWLRFAVHQLGPRCAVHVCGSSARAALLSGSLPWIQDAGRLQVNGAIGEEMLRTLTSRFRVVVTQHRSGATLASLDALGPGEHQLLVDASGGRGLTPSKWSRPETSRAVGFAGGLGPDNLAEELTRIARFARVPWWVDMETKLRRDDWFDLPLAGQCVDLRDQWAEARAA